MFRVDNFEALEKIREGLQEKIFSIEGRDLMQNQKIAVGLITKYLCLVIFAGSQTSGESLKMEMSQVGFSAAYESEVLTFHRYQLCNVAVRKSSFFTFSL